MSSQSRVLFLSLIVMVILAVGLLAIGDVFGPADGNADEKDIVIEVVGPDGSGNEYDITTSAETLGDALYENELVSEDEYEAGYYTVVDGIEADFNADGAWWCLSVDGEMAEVGANDIALDDGEHYEITYTTEELF